MLKSKKLCTRGFTLAEVMIVLTVIGILSAILLPVALHSTPDKNILKFKKANNTLATTIRELVSSGEHYMVGDLGRMPNGVIIHAAYITDDGTHHCKAFADILSAKTTSCTNAEQDGSWVTSDLRSVYNDELVDDIFTRSKMQLDYRCSQLIGVKLGNYIILPDDVQIHMLQGAIFGWTSNNIETYTKEELITNKVSSKNGNIIQYSLHCIDIDGDGPIKPFGYGVRYDGKILNGMRADWWLSRDITKKETDCCPLSLKNALDRDGNAINLCDDSDTVCGS